MEGTPKTPDTRCPIPDTRATPDTRAVDYQAAADRILIALARLDAHRPGAFVPAALLVRLAFPGQWPKWHHESRRRRIRQAVPLARRKLVAEFAGATIEGCTNPGHPGYRLAHSPAAIAAYAARRKRQGLVHLAAAAHQVTPTLAPAGGQQSLFSSPIPPSRYRH